MLCYVTPKEHLGLPNPEDVKQGRDCVQDCGACGGRGAAPSGRAGQRRRIELCTVLFDWNKQFELSLDPATAKAMHDENLPDDFYKEAKFCSMCGPKFCFDEYYAAGGSGEREGPGGAEAEVCGVAGEGAGGGGLK